MKWKLFLLGILSTLPAYSEIVQILHTNDLHTHFDHAVHSQKLGGYARIKTLFDHYKNQAASEGIQTFIVDSGDFLEGHLYYYADKALRGFQILDQMGYDVVTIGNHDWLMGIGDLDNLLGRANPQFAFLGANFISTPFHTHLQKHLKSYISFQLKNGELLTFMGLTTNEIFYKWRVDEGDIENYVKTAKRVIEKLEWSGRGANVIAVTHIGHLADTKLVKKTSGIDLVLGGHSHLALHEPLLVANKDKQIVPIGQSGSKGQYVGRILIDVQKGLPLKILKYELLAVDKFHEDLKIKEIAQNAKYDLNNLYGQNWLNKPIGTTRIPLINNNHKTTIWSEILADALREAVDADAAVHIPALGGTNLPPGPLNRMDLFQAYPRFFDFNDEKGWHIWHAKIYGFIIKTFLKIMVNTEYSLATSGITFNLEVVNPPTEENPGKYKIKDVRIGGEKVKLFKLYSVALPEGIVRGGFGITQLVGYILRQTFKSPVAIWDAVANKVQKIGEITNDYQSPQIGYSQNIKNELDDPNDYLKAIEELKSLKLSDEEMEEILFDLEHATEDDYPNENLPQSRQFLIERKMIPAVEYLIKK